MKESQEYMLEHTEVKIKLLKLYLERYLNIMYKSEFVTDIYLFDLFCGQGVYKDGGKGSPIIILEILNNILNTDKKITSQKSNFICYFNDNNNCKVGNLKAEIEKNKLNNLARINCNIFNFDYKDILPFALKEINSLKKEKAFVFIDPYGYKDISIKDIAALLSNKKTEVLLFLPTQFMFRFETKGTPESLKTFIDEIVPPEQWPESDTGIEFIEKLKEGFKAALGYDYYVDSFIITRNKNQFFSLFFFTNHIYGFEKMLETKWSIDKEEGRGWQFGDDNDLFSSVGKTPNISRFEVDIVSYIKDRERNNAEIYNFTLHNGHLPTHATQILNKLQKLGKIDVNNSDGSQARKASFYINFTDFRDNPGRVKIKYK